MKLIYKAFVCLLFVTALQYSNANAQSYTDYLKEGNKYYKNKDYQRAAEAYEEAVKLADSNINVYFNLGLTYKYLKNYPAAISNFEKFLKVTSNKKMLKSAKKLLNKMSAALSRPTTSGRMKHYEIWEGWILIDGDVIIPENITLTIKPGALVMFAPLSSRYDEKIPYLKKDSTKGLSSLIVRGALIAEGEKENEILFSNSYEDLTTKRVGLWGGVIFENSEKSIFKYVKIERAVNGVIFKDNPEVLFNNNVFMKNDVGIKLIDKSPITIDYNIFYRNETGIECRNRTKAVITNSNFTKNNYGIRTFDSAKPEIINNTFDQNNSGIGTNNKSFPKIFENSFKSGKFGISMIDNSKALIKDNKFVKNKIGINSVANSAPRIYSNTFSENVLTGITTADNSKAEIDANTFSGSPVGILKVESIRIINNNYEDNVEDIKRAEK